MTFSKLEANEEVYWEVRQGCNLVPPVAGFTFKHLFNKEGVFKVRCYISDVVVEKEYNIIQPKILANTAKWIDKDGASGNILNTAGYDQEVYVYVEHLGLGGEEVVVEVYNAKDKNTPIFTSKKITVPLDSKNFTFLYPIKKTYKGKTAEEKKKASKVFWNDNLVEATSFEESNFQYNGNLIVVNKTGYDELADKTKLNQEVSTVTYTVENGNLAKEEVTISPSHKVVTQYTYDNKKNPRSINLQKILYPAYFTNKNLSKNNLLTITETITKNGKTEVKRGSYEYVYNGDYPTTVREFQERNGNRVLEETTEYKY